MGKIASSGFARHRVAEPKVDAHGDARVAEHREECDPQSGILVRVADRLDANRVGEEDEAVVLDGHRAHGLERRDHRFRGRVALRQEIDVPSRPVYLSFPEIEKDRALEHEPIVRVTPTDAIEEALNTEAREHVLQFVATVLREVEQPVANRRGQIGRVLVAHRK
ncbi:MAG: hypothetical protein ABJF01_22905 [bacterium]